MPVIDVPRLSRCSTYSATCRPTSILTLQAEQVASQVGGAAGIAALFLASTVVSMLFQVRVTHSCQRALARGQAVSLGLSVRGLAFLAPLAGTPLTRAVPGDDPLAVAIRLSPVLAAAVLLALGIMSAQPFVNELIPSFGDPRLTGAYFGAFSLMAGLITFAVNALIGAAIDAQNSALGWGPCLLCSGIGVVSGAVILVLHRSGTLPPGATLAANPPPLPSGPDVRAQKRVGHD